MKTKMLILLTPLLLASSTLLRAQGADWQVVPNDYESTMNLVGHVLRDGLPAAEPGDGLAAFVGETVRGVAYPIEVDGQWLYFLTVYANGDGEEIVFKSFEAATGTIRRIDETMPFQANTVSGTVTSPVVLHAGEVDTGAPAWGVEPSAFTASMTVTATVTVAGQPTRQEDALAAFVGESVRGVATPVEYNGQVIFFLTVYANTAGEAVRFQLYEAGTAIIHEVNETLVFETNALHGSVQAPLSLTIGGAASPTATERLDGAVPTTFNLEQNYPNPFNPETTLRYAVPSDVHVTVTVHNVLGEAVATLVDERQSAGRYAVHFDGAGLPSGVYLYRLQAGAFHAARSMLLIK